ncbi:neuroglobin-like [Anabrus simplex]|uniref:neuroglobin-like n=1 Tax=Anabrus simplex TaxID=316456 RepID=UPI0034DD77F1
MGGTASHHQAARKSVSAPSPPSPPAVPEPTSPPELSDRQKELLRETWKELEDNIAKVGVITFISLFETHPDVQAVFMPFSGLPLDELKQSKQLRAHALRVMAFVQKAVARLHEPEKLQTLLQELGKKHHHYGAKEQYVDLIGPQFIQAIQPSLEDRWTPELQQAWAQLFHYIAFFMKGSMEQERLAVEQ